MSPDAQVTWLVMSAVVPLVYVPVAVKWTAWPLATVAVAGVMAMLASVTDGVVPPPPQPASASAKAAATQKDRII